MSLLSLDKVCVRFGGVVAVDNFSMRIEEREITALIGPNGAGKTTAFNAISGIHRANSGEIIFAGSPLGQELSIERFRFFALVGMIVGTVLSLAINIESLWQAAITSLYRFGEPFIWSLALTQAAETLLASFWSSIVPFFFFGFVLGAVTSYILWQRTCVNSTVLSKRGISRTFQNIRLLPNESVIDNVRIGLDSRARVSLIASALRLKSHHTHEQNSVFEANRILEFVGLSSSENARAGSLPYGNQRRLEIARALATHPRLLLLDEPAAGLNPAESLELQALLKKIAASGVTILLIEHDMHVVMEVAQKIVVLEYGKKIAEGAPEQVRNNPVVIAAYLGTEDQ